MAGAGIFARENVPIADSMSFKTRGNYKTGLCLRFDCVNFPVKCPCCFKFKEYKEHMPNEQTDNKKKEVQKDS